jgi:MoxR-like ATPase
MVRVAVGYPERDAEVDVLSRRLARRQEMGSVRTVVDAATLRSMQAGVELVTVEGDILRYCVDLAAATRAHDAVEVGASPRGSLALLKLSRCRAALDGRDYVTPDDVKAVAVPALAHRLTLRPELWVQRISAEDVVRERLATVATPVAEDLART